MRHVLTICLMILAPMAQASTFNINLSFTGSFTDSQKQIFQDSKNLWETLITGYQVAIPSSFGGLAIAADATAIDGAGGVLGRAGPRTGFYAGGFFFAATGEMEFDTADLAAFEAQGLLDEIIIHEMGHVIGFGTLWSIPSAQQLYIDGTGEYIGAYALSEYIKECDPNATFVPVDIVSGPGTRDAHWDENWACGGDELFTGFLGTNAFISQTSIASFADLGYTTVVTHPVPVPASGALMASAFGVFGILAYRRRVKYAA